MPMQMKVLKDDIALDEFLQVVLVKITLFEYLFKTYNKYTLLTILNNLYNFYFVNFVQ